MMWGKIKRQKINCFVASTLKSRNYVKLSEALVGFIFTWDDVHGQEKNKKTNRNRSIHRKLEHLERAKSSFAL